MTISVLPFAVGPIVGTAGRTHIRILGVMPAGALAAGRKAPHGRIRWRAVGEPPGRGPRPPALAEVPGRSFARPGRGGDRFGSGSRE
mgnify:CR=1 FL=1